MADRSTDDRTPSRRRFLTLAGTAALTGLAAQSAGAAVLPRLLPGRKALHPLPPSPPAGLRGGGAPAGDLPPRPRHRPAAERLLSFHNLHTGEKTTVPYWARGDYHPDGTAEIDHILRDWRTDEVVRIDRELFDLLYDLRLNLRSDAPIQVISGYRSPETNAMLRQVSLGVAKRSYHVKGMAIDIRVPDARTRQVHRTALAMRAGGVGYYPASDFVHVDVGPVRTW